MSDKEKQINKLKLLDYSFEHKPTSKEEMILKEVVDNLMLSLLMSLDAIEEVDKSRLFGETEKRSLYMDILDALEYSIDVSLGGKDSFLNGFDLTLEEFNFIKKGE